MSLSFNLPTSTARNGLVQRYEKECGFEYGDISGDNDKLAEFAAEVNEAIDDFWAYILTQSGKWRLDDSNHSNNPELLINIVSGTREYTIFEDSSSNDTLEIFKVFILPSATATQYQEVYPFDPNTQEGVDGFTNGLNQQGQPTYYDLKAMKIGFDLIPDYSVNNGIKILISREGSYFVYNDTTKKPGVPGIFHKYFYLKPAKNYARIHSLESYDKINGELKELEELMVRYFGNRVPTQRNMMRNESTPCG